MDENHAKEFVTCLNALHFVHKNCEKELPIYWNVRQDTWWLDLAPSYFAEHQIKESLWNCPNSLTFDSYKELDLIDKIRLIDLNKSPPRYLDCINDENAFKNKKFYFDSDGKSIEYLNDWISSSTSSLLNHKLTNNSSSNELDESSSLNKLTQESKAVQINFQDNNQENASLNENGNSFKNEKRLAEVEEDEEDNFILISNSNQQQQQQDSSFSDSDPISIGNAESSTDLPMPGQLKATDSLLLLNQIGNENTIISK